MDKEQFKRALVEAMEDSATLTEAIDELVAEEKLSRPDATSASSRVREKALMKEAFEEVAHERGLGEQRYPAGTTQKAQRFLEAQQRIQPIADAHERQREEARQDKKRHVQEQNKKSASGPLSTDSKGRLRFPAGGRKIT